MARTTIKTDATRPHRRLWLPALACLTALGIASGSVADDTPEDPGRNFGFLPIEIFKLSWRNHSLLSGDFNSDGRQDVALVDNSHSRIDLLIQREERPSVEELPMLTGGDINRIDSHWRFEHRKLPVDRAIEAMAVGDFNGDGRADLACIGEPDRLLIYHQPEPGEERWTNRRELRLAEVNTTPWSIAAGDLNSDGRDDLAVLGKETTYLLYQGEEGRMKSPVEVRNTSERLSIAMIRDINGDGLNDLMYLARDVDKQKICARLQRRDGRLGPELRLDVEDPRGITVARINLDQPQALLAIDSSTGRLEVFRMKSDSDADDEIDLQPTHYGIGGRTSGSAGELATGDVDGDGRIDVVVTDPDAAQIIVFRQQGTEGLDSGQSYPSYLGAQQVRIADLDGDDRNEVIVLSEKERTVGISQWEDGRLSFPVTLDLEGTPEAIDVISESGSNGLPAGLLIVSKLSDYSVVSIQKTGDSWKPATIADDKTALTLSLDGSPESVQYRDLDGDGHAELFVTLERGREPQVFRFEDGKLTEIEHSGGVRLSGVSSKAIFRQDQAGKGLLVAQENFARQLRLDENGNWQVADQFGISGGNANIAGAGRLDLDGQPGDELALVDTRGSRLHVLREEDGLFRPWKQVELGSLRYSALHIADVNGDDRDELILLGSGQFLVIAAGQAGDRPQLELVTSYESPRKEPFLTDVVVGDLNNDGRPDVALTDVQKHAIELLDVAPDDTLRTALQFKVFESKSFSGSGEGGSQPREAIIADVTGDGLADLLLLAHDRLLLYPQDDGRQ
ncbi:FG-GAP repeat protein [Maioricimonas rarisocia]|uniref:FG-GAP repeat protein n=1 Tax=Maioricimonas rarisocia TaxID=2528026 RepID=A0A517ZE40_9PLAN|nr:VCBS repeat-containing protein [Maioricimonas rarisocia]QDU40746.1 FG-GAP repeat protein [Maioricimonas rarisocia]